MAKKRGRSRRKAQPARTPAQADIAASPDKPKSADRAQESVRKSGLLDRVLLALVAAGILLTAYLTFTAWFGTHPAYCGADSGCDLVQSSRWSTFLGLPMSLWGLLTYAVLARSLWRLRTRPSAWRFALLVAFVGAGVSWFLTLVSVFQIEATCPWCLASFAIMNLLLVLVLLRRPAHMPQHQWNVSLPVPVAVAGAVVLGLHLHFSGLFDATVGPEEPRLKALAMHLEKAGARFYGAYWCPHCQEQKALFGASVKRLPYVECSPDGRSGPVALACLENDISDYPTWIIDGRNHAGVLQPSELERLTRFSFDGG